MKKPSRLKSLLHRNRNPAGLFVNIIFGIAEIADGLLRLASLGTVCSRLPLEVSRISTARQFAKMRKLSTLGTQNDH